MPILFKTKHFFQCGIGQYTTNVWEPAKVLGLHSSNERVMSDTPPSKEILREIVQRGDEAKIVDVSLGLQHGACCNELGNVYTWGKGERGQVRICCLHIFLFLIFTQTGHTTIIKKRNKREENENEKNQSELCLTSHLSPTAWIFCRGRERLPREQGGH